MENNNLLTEYYTLDENPIDLYGFIFYPSKNIEEYDDGEGKKKLNITVNGGTPEYNDVYNNYKVKISQTLKFKLDKSSDDIKKNNILNYVITVPFDWKSNKSPYLRGLTTLGSINLDLLNSGESSIVGYRFNNNIKEGKTTMVCSFELYPKEGKQFTDLTLKFYEFNAGSGFNDEESISLTFSGEVKNTNTLKFSWDDKIKGNKLYKVIISYKDCDGNTINNDDYWFLSTELFNSCFSVNNSNNLFVSNYCKPIGTKEINIIKDKLTIKLKHNIRNKNIYQSSVTYETEGNLISESKEIDFKSIQKDEISIDKNAIELQIENQEYYPDYIKLDKNDYEIELESGEINRNEIDNQLPDPVSIGEKLNKSDYFKINNNNGKITITSIERVVGTGIEALLENVFVKMSDALPDLLDSTRRKKLHCGIFPDVDRDGEGEGEDVLLALLECSSDEKGGITYGYGDDVHEYIHPDFIGKPISWAVPYNNFNTKLRVLNFYTSGNNFGIVENVTDNNELSIPWKVLNDTFNNEYGDNEEFIDSDISCTWLFSTDYGNEKYYYKTERNSLGASIGLSAQGNTVIWWRSIDDNDNSKTYWRASKVIINENIIGDPVKLTEALFGSDFYFCFIKNTESGQSGLYIPSDTLYKYIFDNDIEVILPITGKIEIPDKDKIGIKKGEIIKFNLEYGSSFNLDNISYKVKHDKNTLDDKLQTLKSVNKPITKNGIITDSMKLELNKDYIYTEDNNQLKKVEVNPFILSNTTFVNTKGYVCRYLYCNENNINYSGSITFLNGKPSSIAINDGITEKVRIYFHDVPLIPQIK